MKTDFSILMLVLWLCIGVIYLLVAVLQLFNRVRRLSAASGQRPAPKSPGSSSRNQSRRHRCHHRHHLAGGKTKNYGRRPP
jgi:hypothetical protein